MKLTIITINRNNSDGLRKTIESVISQTYKGFEYIVIDGASTDKSIDVVLSYKDKISYWVSEPDTGIYNAMNKGIRKANGDYLLFLNSGDYLVDETVIESVFVERPQSDIVCCRCNVSQDGKVIWVSNPPQRVTFATLFFQGLNHQSTFIKRSLLMELGLYDESFKYNADIDFWYRSIILNNASTQRVDVIMTNYNLEGISMTESSTFRFQEEHAKIRNMPILNNIFPDYERWKEERRNYFILNWIEHHPLIMRCLLVLYKIEKKIKR